MAGRVGLPIFSHAMVSTETDKTHRWRASPCPNWNPRWLWLPSVLLVQVPDIAHDDAKNMCSFHDAKVANTHCLCLCLLSCCCCCCNVWHCGGSRTCLHTEDVMQRCQDAKYQTHTGLPNTQLNGLFFRCDLLFRRSLLFCCHLLFR